MDTNDVNYDVRTISSTIVPMSGDQLRPGSSDAMRDDDRGLFSISVVTELTGVDQQQLRAYEARGLIRPERTKGGTRRYSRNDVDRITEIAAILLSGVNHEGALQLMDLRAENEELRRKIDRQSSE